MKTQTFLHINNPCNENWNNMSDTEKGKFCNACAQEVVDFSGMTDNQVLQFLAKSNTKVCGRIHTNQLQRALHNIDHKKSNSVQWILAGFTSLFFSTAKSQQTEQNTKEVPAKHIMGKINPVKQAALLAQHSITVRGKIISAEQEALLNSYIINPLTQEKIFTNKKGEFVAQISAENKTILAGALGYQSRVVPVDMLQMKDTSITLLKTDTSIVDVSKLDPNKLDGNIIMGGITTFTEVEKPNPVITFIKKVFNNNFFKINPNPANKNGVNITVNYVGTYSVQIFDNNSRLLHTQEVVVTAKGEPVYINFNGCVTKGTYYIRLVDIKTKKQYTDKLLVQ